MGIFTRTYVLLGIACFMLASCQSDTLLKTSARQVAQTTQATTKIQHSQRTLDEATKAKILKRIQAKDPFARPIFGTQHPIYQGYLASKRSLGATGPFQTQSFAYDWRSYTNELVDNCNVTLADEQYSSRWDVPISRLCRTDTDTDTYTTGWEDIVECQESTDSTGTTLGYPIFNVTSLCVQESGAIDVGFGQCVRFEYAAELLECLLPEEVETSADLSGINILNYVIADSGSTLHEQFFSPRDQNDEYDLLYIEIETDEHLPDKVGRPSWSLYLEYPNLEPGNPGIKIASGEGASEISWNGFADGKCLTDNKYELVLYRDDYNENEPLNGVYTRTAVFIDNTPPVVENLEIIQTVVDEENEEYSSDVSFEVFDPRINLVNSELAGVNEFKSTDIQVSWDNQPLFNLPVLDDEGFWITSNPVNELDVEDIGGGRYKVSFTVPVSLENSLLDVSVSDLIFNKATYTLSTEGVVTKE